MTDRDTLVTGANGFVGSHLVRALASHGRRVAVAVRECSRARVPQAVSRILEFDLERPESLSVDALSGIDCLYHLAARVHVMRSSPEDTARFLALNARATEVLARTAAEAGVRRFVFLSSIKVNGERTLERPFVAADSPGPQDAYGASKRAAEQALLSVAESTGLEIAIVRPPLVYGPGVGANFRRLLSLVHARVPLPFAAIDNRRSIVSVWNLIDLLERVGSHPLAVGRIWLVSDGEDVSTPQLLRAIGTAMDHDVRLWKCPVSWLRALGSATGRRQEIARLVDSLRVDITATRTELAWRPPVSFDDGLARTVAWFLETRRAG